MPKVKVFLGRCIFTKDDEIHEVKPFFNNDKLTVGFAYIKGDLVYIFHGKINKLKSDLEPGIYIENGTYKFVEPSKKERKIYSIDNITELNIDWLFDKVKENKDNFANPDDVEIINNNTETYTPTIKPTDDFLKVAVKKIITEKKINLKNYKSKFLDNYALNNRKSGLNNNTKMSVSNFKIWCEVLGIDWRLEIFDSGVDKMNPLKESIIIDSKDF